jgi:DNA repair protein RecN (Recombination protein N)
MLTELRVENYAVIDNVAVEFAAGLNLLTGETGAGKSILIDALALLLGEKSSSGTVRHGAEKAVVSGVFQVEGRAVDALLEANGLDSEGEQLIVRREVAAGGKGRVFVNNQPATAGVLKQLAPHLAAVHAQSESILSFDAATRLELLDTFAALDGAACAAAFANWKSLRERIADLERNEQDRLRLLDLWQFQRKEIAEARPEAGEDQKLETEKRILANAEKLYTAASGAYDLLYESNSAAAGTLRAALRQVEELARYDEKFKEPAETLESAAITVEDAAATLRDYAESIHASPERLAEVEDRLALLDRLKRKYGNTLEQVIAYGREVARKVEEVEHRDERLAELRKELESAAQEYLQEARTLSRRRYDTARKLEKLVEAEINDLAMKARFKIEVAGTDEEGNWTAEGFDRVQYLVAANPGEPLGPVEKIASGGELSRVLLALKATIEAGSKRRRAVPRTLVFDEIDIGIGGRAAEAVGKKLKSLARAHQVLCITHLPQIASFADHHFLLEKRESAGRSRTAIRLLDEAERREEIARMLSGAKLTDASRKHAEQLLKANA